MCCKLPLFSPVLYTTGFFNSTYQSLAEGGRAGPGARVQANLPKDAHIKIPQDSPPGSKVNTGDDKHKSIIAFTASLKMKNKKSGTFVLSL